MTSVLKSPITVSASALSPGSGGAGPRPGFAVADAADRWLDPGFCQPFGVSDRNVLHAAVAVVHEITVDRAPVVQRLIERVEDEPGLGAARDPPADDAPGEGGDDQGDVDEAGPGGDAVRGCGDPAPHRG